MPTGRRPSPGSSETDLARRFVVNVTLMNGEPYTFNLHDVTWIDLEDLHAACAGQAQRYAFYAMIHVGVKDALRAARGELAAFVVEQSEVVRAELGPKATETHVKQATAARPGYREIQDRVERFESLESRVGIVREALTQRRDMLESCVMLRGPERGPAPGDGGGKYRLVSGRRT